MRDQCFPAWLCCHDEKWTRISSLARDHIIPRFLTETVSDSPLQRGTHPSGLVGFLVLAKVPRHDNFCWCKAFGVCAHQFDYDVTTFKTPVSVLGGRAAGRDMENSAGSEYVYLLAAVDFLVRQTQ